MIKVKLEINGKQREVSVRPPTQYNRKQFVSLICQQYGITQGDMKRLSTTMFYELSIDELKDYLKAATDISFADKEAVDLEHGDNADEAMKAVINFFLQLGATMRKSSP